MFRKAMLCAALFLAPITAMADEVHLEDGSKVVGKVTRIVDNKITVKTDFAGEIVIDATKVKGVTTAEDANVHLDTGDKVIGKLNYDPATNTQTVQGEVVGNKPVAVKQVVSTWPKGTEDPAVTALRAKWKVRLELGLNGQTGNSELVNLNGALVVKRETPGDRLTMYLLGRYSRDNGERTAHEVIGGALWEVDLTDRLFWYIKGEMEQDEFEHLDLRAFVTTGLGYFLIREKDTELKVRGGIGFMHESFDDGTSEDTGIAELGVDFRKDINDWLSFVHSTTYYPTCNNIDDHRIVMVNALEIPISNDKMWKMKLGVRNQYDSQPSDDVDKLDSFYFANVGVDF